MHDIFKTLEKEKKLPEEVRQSEFSYGHAICMTIRWKLFRFNAL